MTKILEKMGIAHRLETPPIVIVLVDGRGLSIVHDVGPLDAFEETEAGAFGRFRRGEATWRNFAFERTEETRVGLRVYRSAAPAIGTLADLTSALNTPAGWQ